MLKDLSQPATLPGGGRSCEWWDLMKEVRLLTGENVPEDSIRMLAPSLPSSPWCIILSQMQMIMD